MRDYSHLWGESGFIDDRSMDVAAWQLRFCDV